MIGLLFPRGQQGSSPEALAAFSEAQTKLTKAQELVRKWQLSTCEQALRRDLGCFGRVSSFRVNTIGPLTEALEAVREAIESEKILGEFQVIPPHATVFRENNKDEFIRLSGLVERALDAKLGPVERQKWTAFPFCQFLTRTQEGVTTTEMANKLLVEARKWSYIGRSGEAPPFSNLEQSENIMVTSEAKWNVYGGIARNITLAALGIAGVVAAGIYVKAEIEQFAKMKF